MSKGTSIELDSASLCCESSRKGSSSRRREVDASDSICVRGPLDARERRVDTSAAVERSDLVDSLMAGPREA